MSRRSVDILIRASDKASKRFDRIGRSARGLGGAFRSLQGLAAGVGIGIGVAALARQLTDAVGKAIEFRKQMASVSTMLRGPALKNMENYTMAVRDLAIEVGQTTETLSVALKDILSAQVDPSQAIPFLRVGARTALGGFTETRTVVEALLSIMAPFKIELQDVGDTADFMFGVFNKGRVTFEQLAQGIGETTATAAASGVSLEELGAFIATATRQGVRAEKVFTGFTASIDAMQKASAESVKIAKDHGVELSAQALATKGLLGMFKELEKIPKDLIPKLFGRRAKKSILAVRGDLKGFIRDIEFLTKERVGLAEEAVQKALPAAAFDRFVRVIDDIKIELAEGLLPALKDFADWFVENRLIFRDWANAVADSIKVIASLVEKTGITAVPTTGAVVAEDPMKALTAFAKQLAITQPKFIAKAFGFELKVIENIQKNIDKDLNELTDKVGGISEGTISKAELQIALNQFRQKQLAKGLGLKGGLIPGAAVPPHLAAYMGINTARQIRNAFRVGLTQFAPGVTPVEKADERAAKAEADRAAARLLAEKVLAANMENNRLLEEIRDNVSE